MRKKKPFVLLISITLALLFVTMSFMLACAKPAPAPTPAPAPAPAPTPAPAPAPTHEEVEIKILTGKFGGVVYTMGTGFAEMINKHSEWLKATAVETGGTNDATMYGYDNPADRRLDLRVYSDGTDFRVRQGLAPFDKQKYIPPKVFMYAFNACNAVFVIDPDIKTPQDLVGKSIAMGAKGSGQAVAGEFILNQAYGMEGQYKPVYLGYSEAKDGLLAGTVSAQVSKAALTISADGKAKFTVGPDIQELWTLKEGAHFLDVSKAQITAGQKIAPVPAANIVVPAGALGEKQPEAFGTAATLVIWAAYPEMDDDIAYEICRVADEYYAEFADYHAIGKGINPNTFGWLFGTEADVHAGARKYYEENGIPIYVGGEGPPVK